MDPISLVDLNAQYRAIQTDVQAALNRVIESSGFIMGPEVAAFEEEFASFCGARHAIGMASGTGALHLALHALGVGPGDEVITVPHTFIATAEAIIHCGARPVFVDVDPVFFTMDPEQLESAITSKTRAIMPVHLYGQCADMDPILDLAERHGLPVVEDAAQAHGALYGGRPAGTLGRAACYSFYPGKNLGAYGDGGAVTTNDDALAERLARLRNHGRKEKYVHLEIGFGERLDALQAAVLRVKLARLDEWTRLRIRHAARYDEGLEGLPGIVTPAVRPGDTHVYHLYVILTAERERLLAHLRERGVRAGVHYPVPLHRQPALDYLPYGEGDFPVTEKLAQSVLSLPIYPELTEAQIDHTVDAVRSFYLS